jgi:phycocyanobilin:ferredoxin oxidoreductase
MRPFHPLIERIAQGLRPDWQKLHQLQPLTIPGELKQVRGELEGDALQIDNELLSCAGLRKIHLETARFGPHLDILHCVLFPDPCYNLPIFGADVVAGRGCVSAAIVDLSPSGTNLSEQIDGDLAQLEAKPYGQRRDVPGWGSIFSPHVLFIRPDSATEEEWFYNDVMSFHRIFIDAVCRTQPDPPTHSRSISRYEGQLRYCQQQRRNDKTRRVLESAFDAHWADNYICKLLFDDPLSPAEQPCQLTP